MLRSSSACVDDEHFLAAFDDHLRGLVSGEHVDAFGAKAPRDELGDLGVFAHEYARQHFHLRHLGA